MPEPSGFERRYSQREAARVLRRAAELQMASLPDPSAEEGLTLSELQRIGEEVGLQSEQIEAALRGLESEGDEMQTRLLGAPPSYALERTLEGTLGDYAWHALVGELNSYFHQSVEGVVSGPVRTWQWKHGLGYVHFSATQLRGSVRLKIVAYIDDGITVAFIPLLVAMLSGAAGFWSVDAFRPWISILLSLVLVGGLVIGFRSITSNWYRQDRRRMNRLMDQLEVALRQPSDDEARAIEEASGSLELEPRLRQSQ